MDYTATLLLIVGILGIFAELVPAMRGKGALVVCIVAVVAGILLLDAQHHVLKQIGAHLIR